MHFLVRILGCILLMLAISTSAFALGGDPIAPFPVLDPVAAKQEARAMVVDSSGNIIVAGYHTVSGMNRDYRVVKFRADGSGIAWTATYDKVGGDDQATAVAVDGNDDVIVTGTAWSGSSLDIHTIKYSGATGAELWQHTWSGVPGGADLATAIVVDSSNSIYVAGYSANASGNDDYLILKYPASGTTPQWQEIWNNPAANSNDRITAIAAGPDGIVVTGYSSAGGTNFDILTRKYGFDKSFIWEQRKASAGTGDDRGVALRIDEAGEVYVAGYLHNGRDNDIYLARYGAVAPGTAIWESTFAGVGNDEPVALAMDTGGDVYLTGYTYTYGGNEDVFTARYRRSDGVRLWSASYNSGSDYTDIPIGLVVQSGADGDVYVTGYTTTSSNENITTLKYKKGSGELAWQQSYNGPSGRNERPVGVALDGAGEVCVAGWSDTLATAYDFIAIKYDHGRLDLPTGLTATTVSNTSIVLAWRDNAANEAGDAIERKLGQHGTYAPLITVAADSLGFTDNTVTANNVYYYRVRAFNVADGNSAWSNEAHALTKVVSYDPPVWTYRYNGADNREDEVVGITTGSDDHPVVIGSTDLTEEGVAASYSFDYMAIKLDRANAAVKWRARYDSGDGGTDLAAGLVLDGNNDAIVTGTAYLSGGAEKSDDLYTIKYNSAGHTDPVNSPPVAWGEQYGTQAGIDQATAIQAARDGDNSVVVIGHGINAALDEDMFILKYQSDGIAPWPPIVYDGGTGGNDYPSAVALDSAGNIFITGSTENAAGNFDIYTAKYSGTTGALLWSHQYAGAGNGDDHGLSIAVDRQGDAYVTGYGVNGGGNEEWVTLKFAGAVAAPQRVLWQKVWNGPAAPINGNDRGIAVAVDPIDGNVIVAGTAYVSATDSDLQLVRYDQADGAVIWERGFARPGRYEYAAAMAVDSSGYIYAAANSRTGIDTDPAFDSSSDLLALIYDFEGAFLGATTYDGGLQDEARAIAANYRGEAFLAGTSRNAANPDYLVLKQTNAYLLVPAPLTVTPQADSMKLTLGWQANTPGTSFQIDRTPAPVLPTSTWTPVATPAPGTVSYQDSGLAAGTAYCYRIYAYNGSFSSRTIQQCGTTTLVAPLLSPLVVDSANQLTLSWGEVGNSTGYRIERKIGAGGTWAVLATKDAGVTTHTDGGLTPGTTYYYRVSAGSASGWSLPSGEQFAPTLPAAPVMAAFGTTTTTTVIINWTNVAGETGYRIERKQGDAGSWSEITTRVADNLTYTDNSGLTANTLYYYRVRAFNSSGNSLYSDEQPVMTKVVTPMLTGAVGAAVDKINLTWDPVPDATGYTVEMTACVQNGTTSGAANCSNTSYYYNPWNPVVTVAATNYQVTGLTAGFAYRYRIIARIGANSSDPSNAIIAWTWMSQPSVSVAPASENSLTVNWTDVAGETNYTLERKLGPGGTWAEVAGAIGLAANTTTRLDSGLSLSTNYCYRVKAYSTNPSGPPAVYSSNEPCLSTPLVAPVQNPPSGVTDIQATLSWNPVANVTGYELERCEYFQPHYPNEALLYVNTHAYWNACSVVATLPSSSTTYQDSALTNGMSYRYRVRDTFTGGVSAWSNGQVLTTIPPTPWIHTITSFTTTQIYLGITNNIGETSYSLEWKERIGTDCTAGAWSAPITLPQNTLDYYHDNRVSGTYYCYRLRAANNTGISAYSGVVSRTTLAGAPLLNPPSGITASQIVLTWNRVNTNTGYRVERKIGPSGTWGLLTTTAANIETYTNTSLTPGTQYSYRVSTVNPAGVSTASNIETVTTTPATPALTATTQTAAQISLSWPLVFGATNYKIERKQGAGSYAELTNLPLAYGENYCGYGYPTVGCTVLSPATVTHLDSGLVENTEYCYKLRAWNGTGGDSAYSTERCKTTLHVGGSSLIVTPLNSFKIRLDWNEVPCTPNPCGPPDAYEVERQLRDGVWTRIATVSGTVSTYTDKIAIDPNRQYRYRIRSVAGATRSPYTEATAFTPPYRAGDNVGP